EAGHEPERRGLAAAGGAEEGQHLAGGHAQREAVDGGRGIPRVALRHAGQAEEAHDAGPGGGGTPALVLAPVARIASSTGPSPARTSASAGTAASTHSDSAVRRQVTTARVSRPNGRSSRVAGSSFITST